MGFQVFDTDASVFTKKGIIITIYINNFFITSDLKAGINALKAALSEQFKISDLGPYHFYLSIEITYNRPCRVFYFF